MLFNSFEFVVFLPVVFLLYWFVFRSRKWQNLFIVIVSYIFYGWWDWRFLFLIAFTTLCSFFSGLTIEKYEGRRSIQRFISGVNILLNLVILGTFKYYNFFMSSLTELLAIFDIQLGWTAVNIILPVGISFYTFQALSYSIDVYKHKLRATHDIVAFFAFVSFFPQLVAGPIERATNLLPQFLKSRSFDYEKAVDGCRQMLWGFFKKIVVADNCATIVDTIWANYSECSGFTLLIGAFLFTIQIYCDFSGYSDIAIGCSRLFGISLMRNFNFPYFSRNIAEFWRRWHISLTTWFRDYIYFPLGGSRCSMGKVIRNTFVVFLVSGLWHGANWTYIVWGLYHGLMMGAFMLIGWNKKYPQVVAYNKMFPSAIECVQMVVTFFLVLLGWIIFRADNLSQALDYMNHMFSVSLLDFHYIFYTKKIFLFILILLVGEWLQRNKQHALQFSVNGIFRNRIVRYAVYAILLVLMILFVGKAETFIYFQF